MSVKLLTEHHLGFLSLTGGCRGSSESTLVKMSNCWKSHAAAQMHRVFWGHAFHTPLHIMPNILEYAQPTFIFVPYGITILLTLAMAVLWVSTTDTQKYET